VRRSVFDYDEAAGERPKSFSVIGEVAQQENSSFAKAYKEISQIQLPLFHLPSVDHRHKDLFQCSAHSVTRGPELGGSITISFGFENHVLSRSGAQTCGL